MHERFSVAADRRTSPLHAHGWRTELHPEPFPSGLVPARILAHSRGLSLVLHEGGETWVSPTGRFRDWLDRQHLQPCAGDWLLVQVADAQSHRLLPRHTALVRQAAGPSGRAQVLAAHVDVVFLVMALDRDFNPARMERLLALAWGSGAEPVVLLTKADQVEDPAPWIHRMAGAAPGVALHALSALTGAGLDAVTGHLGEGRTGVLLGASGAGKSTLLNHLLGFEARRTQAVRSSDGRGRHTTSLRELFLLPGGGCLIDTPGIREVGLLAEASDLDTAFSDVEAWAQGCRYRDCQHGAEPGCAVQAALLEGHLDPTRYQAFLRLRREVAFEAARSDERLWRERESRWKDISRQAKRLRKGF